MTTVLDSSPGPVRRTVPFSVVEITEEARHAADRAMASGWVTSGPEVQAFEQELAASVGARFGVAVSSCTAALEIALRALHLSPGAKVITPTMTFCGAVQAIVHAGLRPVLADVDPVTVDCLPEHAAEAARRAGGVDAMVVLHYAGQPAPVLELAEAAGIPVTRVVEDAAHAIGTRVGFQPVGALSAATCFSFYATKNLPIGEGGMLTTDDPEIADYSRQVRLHGMSRDAWRRYQPGGSWRYSVDVAGLKANMTDVQAAIGRAQLRHFGRWQETRRRLVSRYSQQLEGITGVTTPEWPTRGVHAWHLYVPRIGPAFGVSRDQLIDRLAERGIGTSVHFIPIHHHPYYQALLGRDMGEFRGADAAFEQIVSLPLHPLLSDDDVDDVCEAIVDVQQEARIGKGRPSPRRAKL
jgi:dTDP-4-amino-4,6-dideoxygalactose transaminase